MIAHRMPLNAGAPLPKDVGFYAEDIWPAITTFPEDSGPTKTEPNSILSHPLVRYYERGWSEWMN